MTAAGTEPWDQKGSGASLVLCLWEPQGLGSSDVAAEGSWVESGR